ncbi:hypothetical protein ACPWT1_18490 [Ramlibacter sp. MMS24-I3-19]|uniref:hypothetical protein n=1 Tax=Ramlibacter sp. MMS24-I3-19 TaxID=3416606 RepID=UPI003CFCC319
MRPARNLQQGPHTTFVQSMVRSHGRDATAFDARILDDGSVAVSGPMGTALYPLGGWTSKFVRHLEQGYFGPATAAADQEGG